MFVAKFFEGTLMYMVADLALNSYSFFFFTFATLTYRSCLEV